MKKRGILCLVVLVVLSALTLGATATEYDYNAALPTESSMVLQTETGGTTASYTLYPALKLDSLGQYTLSGSPVAVTYSNANSYIGWFYKSGSTFYKFSGVTYTAPVPDTIQAVGTKSCCVAASLTGNTGDWWVYCYDSISLSGGKVVGSGLTYTSNLTVEQALAIVEGKYTYFVENGEQVYVYVDSVDNYEYGENIALDVHTYEINVNCQLMGIVNDPAYYKWNFSKILMATVTFKSNNGEADEMQSVIKNTKAVEPSVAREFYTLKGWKKA